MLPWVLRAAVSLARLWARQNRFAEARQALAVLHGTFSEGFDTPDILEARALLDHLESAADRVSLHATVIDGLPERPSSG